MARIVVTAPSSPTFDRNAVLFPRFESFERSRDLSDDEDESEELARLRMRSSSRDLLNVIAERDEWDGPRVKPRRERTRSAPEGRRVRVVEPQPRRRRHIPEPPSWHAGSAHSYASYPTIAGRRRSAPSSALHLPDLWSPPRLERLPALHLPLPDPSAALQRASEAFQIGLIALLGAAALWTLCSVLVASYGLTAIDSLGAVKAWSKQDAANSGASTPSASSPGTPTRDSRSTSRHPPRPPLASLGKGLAFTAIVALSDQLGLSH